jgi:hypothetical protein
MNNQVDGSGVGGALPVGQGGRKGLCQIGDRHRVFQRDVIPEMNLERLYSILPEKFPQGAKRLRLVAVAVKNDRDCHDKSGWR